MWQSVVVFLISSRVFMRKLNLIFSLFLLQMPKYFHTLSFELILKKQGHRKMSLFF